MNSVFLLIVEVLAVGDSALPRKGVNRMNHCKEVGKTMVLVTHNLGLARTRCNEGAWLDAGQIKTKADLTEVVKANTEQRCNEFIKAFGGQLGDKIFKTCTKEDAALRHTPGRCYQHNTGTCR